MSKTTSYAMYPHSVIGFGFAIHGFKLFAHLEAKAFKTKLCVHTSCGVALPDTQGVSSGRFLRAREIGKAVHEILQSIVDGPHLPSNAFARESHPRSKTTPPCLQTWHPRSEPSARKLSPDRRKKGCSKLAPEQTKRVLGAQKRGQAFCMILIAGQVGGPSFGSRFRPQKWDRKMQKKGPAFCLRASVVARSLA